MSQAQDGEFSKRERVKRAESDPWYDAQNNLVTLIFERADKLCAFLKSRNIKCECDDSFGPRLGTIRIHEENSKGVEIETLIQEWLNGGDYPISDLTDGRPPSSYLRSIKTDPSNP